MMRRTCFKRKRALCANAHDGCCWTDVSTCAGFDYACDCCGTCAHYLEDSVLGGEWYDKHPGVCAAIGADDPLSTFDDYMQVFWFDPPCLMFDGGLR